MIVSRRIPVLAYLFLSCLIALYAFKFHLSTLVDEDDPTPFDFALSFQLKPELPDELPAPNVLVLVTTIASEFEMRNQVRKSWANYTSNAVRVKFLMGIPADKQLPLIQKESQEFNDLIIADLDEGYYSLASKTMAMLIYKTRYYPDTKCLVKADVDNVLILRNYERLCEEAVAPLILGKCDVSRTVLRNTTKWAVPEFVYSEPVYPTYCSTGTYVLAGKTVPQSLIKEAMSSPFANSLNFRKLSEDVIFTGILAEKAGIKRRHINGLSFFEIPEFFCRNGFKTTYSTHLLSDKNPVKNFYKLMKIEGVLCRWWDPYAVRRWRS
ncbi:Hexosyltransferase [Caenorhabditis elegans]|uniref:Hexosyltransferase n=1 Tax=Caenorhabditis elegans TaxID=6239 RepID=D3KZG1_CAEEL|nr:Hexosyltransferase [Caenorhabditis elegans]CCD72807.1 Hexosyltransferase [Caenorhabditis elegans]|eukprot:NP_001255234.1 Hexosyltransferase [Caenorhabditis elegans]